VQCAPDLASCSAYSDNAPGPEMPGLEGERAWSGLRCRAPAVAHEFKFSAAMDGGGSGANPEARGVGGEWLGGTEETHLGPTSSAAARFGETR